MAAEFYRIYVITNLINLKKYVGQTAYTVAKRWRQHCSAAKTKKVLHFHRAINKYGPENFKIEWVASTLTKEDANYLEEKWIRELKTYLREFGYNSTYGGEGAKHNDETKAKLATLKLGKPGTKWTPERRAAASERQRGPNGSNWGKHASDETREKMSQAHSWENNHLFGVTGKNHPAFGITHSEESKRVRSEKLSGEKNPMFGKTKEKNPRFGKTHTEETKQLLSNLAKTRTGEKNPFFGKKHSEETRAKMKTAWERRRAKNNSDQAVDKPKNVV